MYASRIAALEQQRMHEGPAGLRGLNDEPCALCAAPVFQRERVRVPVRGLDVDLLIHRACFKCAACRRPLSLAKYACTPASEGAPHVMYCLDHDPDRAPAARPDAPDDVAETAGASGAERDVEGGAQRVGTARARQPARRCPRLADAWRCAALAALCAAHTLLVRAAAGADGGGPDAADTHGGPDGVGAHAGGYPFHPASMCLAIEALKLGGSLCALALPAKGGARRPAPRAAAPRTRAAACAALGACAVAGAAQCVCALLRFACLARVSAPTFRTLLNADLLFTTLLARGCGREQLRALSARERGVAVLTVVGCALAQLDARQRALPPAWLGLLVLQAALGSLGRAASHAVLRASGQRAQPLGAWQQRAAQSGFATLALAALIAARAPELLASSGAFLAGHGTRAALAVLVSGALAGLAAADPPRTLPPPAAELSIGAETALTALAACALLGARPSAGLKLGTAMVVGARVLHAMGAAGPSSRETSRRVARGRAHGVHVPGAADGSDDDESCDEESPLAPSARDDDHAAFRAGPTTTPMDAVVIASPDCPVAGDDHAGRRGRTKRRSGTCRYQ